MTTYTISGPAKFGGRCVKCGQTARDFESTLLRDTDGKFAVAHDRCAGVKFKTKIGGGRVQVSGPSSMEA